MTLIDAVIALAVLLAATVGAGGVVRWRHTRPRPEIEHEVIEPTRLGADALGAKATILQFSTQTCAKCPAVHRTLGDVAAQHEGVTHLNIDLTHRPDIARHFHVVQTPTTLILNSEGVVQTRFGGAARRDVVELELARVVADPQPAGV